MEDKALLFVFTTLVFIAESVATDYKAVIPYHYEYSEKFNCATKLDVFLDRGILSAYSEEFLGTWPGNMDFDCGTNVYSKTRNTGIIVVIQKLRFRKKFESCNDYVQFDEDATHRCGDIVFGLKQSKSGKLPPPPEFISSFSGLFSRDWRDLREYALDGYGNRAQYVDPRMRFVSSGAVVTPSYRVTTTMHVDKEPPLDYDENLQFITAYTGFQDCEDTNFSADMFNCGYGVCILNIFVNDGVVNCPFGDCRDEGGCDNAIRTSPLMTGEVNATDASNETVSVGHLWVRQDGGGVAVRHPASVPMAYAPRDAPAGNEVKVIGEELRKHNDILGRISSLLERGVAAIEEGVEAKERPVGGLGANGNALEVGEAGQDKALYSTR